MDTPDVGSAVPTGTEGPSGAPRQGLGDLFSGLSPDTLDMLLKGILAAKARQAAQAGDLSILGEQAEGEPPMPMDPDAGNERGETPQVPTLAYAPPKAGKGMNPADLLSGKGSMGALRAKAATRFLTGGKSKHKKNGGKSFFAGGKGGKGLTLKSIGVK